MPRTHSARRLKRLRLGSLHWADRTGLAIAAILAAMAAGFWIIVCVAVGSFAYTRLDTAMLEWTLYGEVAVAVPIWAALRGSSLIAGYGRRTWRLLRAGLAAAPAAIKPNPIWR